MQQKMTFSNDSVNRAAQVFVDSCRSTGLVFKSLGLASLCIFSGVAAQGSEIVFTDSQAAVLRTGDGAPAVIASGTKLMQPFGIAVGQREFFVTDTGCLGIVGITRRTKEQRLVSGGGSLGVPFGIALEQSGQIVVANGQ